jgi:hypothetical protein
LCGQQTYFFTLDWLSCPKVAQLFCALNVSSRADLGLLLCVLLHWFWNAFCLRRGLQFMLIDQVHAHCYHHQTSSCCSSMNGTKTTPSERRQRKWRGQGLYFLSWKTRWVRVYLRTTCTINFASEKKSGCTSASLPCIWERNSEYRDFGLGPLVKIQLLRQALICGYFHIPWNLPQRTHFFLPSIVQESISLLLFYIWYTTSVISNPRPVGLRATAVDCFRTHPTYFPPSGGGTCFWVVWWKGHT